MWRQATWVAALWCASAASASETTRVIHVDAAAAPGGDGSSWAMAYADLQDALAAATPSESDDFVYEVRIAEGVYRPDRGTGDREQSFILLGDVALIGGYPSGGGAEVERDPEAHPTVLCGDLMDDDDPSDPGSWNDNAHHVVDSVSTSGSLHLTSDAILDGLVIRRGAAPDQGGGLNWIARGARLVIRNCLFEQNSAGWNAGALYVGPNTMITGRSVVFRANTAYWNAGAVLTESPASFSQSRFEENEAGNEGGALVGELALVNCEFIGNRADRGGAISGFFNNAGRNRFVGNRALYGGALYFGSWQDAFVVRGEFIDNIAMIDGGAVYGGAALRVRESSFIRNRAGRDGGAVFASESVDDSHTLLFVGNSAGDRGGAIWHGPVDASTGVQHATFVGNSAYSIGALPYAETWSGSRSLILWENTDFEHGDGTVGAHTGGEAPPHSVVEGAVDDPSRRVVGAAPQFVDAFGPDGIAASGDEDYRLRAGSPAIDLPLTSDNDQEDVSFLVAYDQARDLDDRARFVDGDGDGRRSADAGAFEAQDCDGDGVLDVLAIELGLVSDCNGNQIPDECELRVTASFGVEVVGEVLNDVPGLPPEEIRRRIFLADQTGRDEYTITSFVHRPDGWAREAARRINPPVIDPEQTAHIWRLLFHEESLVVVWVMDLPSTFVSHFVLEDYWLEDGSLVGPVEIPIEEAAAGTPVFRMSRSGDALGVMTFSGPTILHRDDHGWSVAWSAESPLDFVSYDLLPTISVGDSIAAYLDAQDAEAPRLVVLERHDDAWIETSSIDLAQWREYGWNDVGRIALLGTGDVIAVGPFYGSLGARAQVWTRAGDSWSGPTELPSVLSADQPERTEAIAATQDAFVISVRAGLMDTIRDHLLTFYRRDAAGAWQVDSYIHESELNRWGPYRSIATMPDAVLLPSFRDNVLFEFIEARSADVNDNAVPDECDAPCPSDVTNDGLVNGADLGVLLGAFGANDAELDLNADGVIDGADVGLLLGAWGVCP